jgi:hypothetical protein
MFCMSAINSLATDGCACYTSSSTPAGPLAASAPLSLSFPVSLASLPPMCLTVLTLRRLRPFPSLLSFLLLLSLPHALPLPILLPSALVLPRLLAVSFLLFFPLLPLGSFLCFLRPFLFPLPSSALPPIPLSLGSPSLLPILFVLLDHLLLVVGVRLTRLFRVQRLPQMLLHSLILIHTVEARLNNPETPYL